jgi:hypothetical protein
LITLAGAGDDAAVAAARHAAEAAGAPAGARADRPIAMVYPGYAERATLLAGARPIDQPWMFDVALAILRDRRLVAVASGRDTARVPPALPSSFLPIAHDGAGRAIAAAAAARAAGADRLLIVADVEPASLESAALLLAAAAAAGPATPGALPAEAWSADELRARERPPGRDGGGPAGARGESDGRWMWAVALALMAAEVWARRSPRQAQSKIEETLRERVA